jgi:RNA polymerase sigma-70 factor (ECF subfamily)
VLQARGGSPEAKAALSDLCAAYYAPAFAFIRRNTPDEESARDLTQEFFARLLARQAIDGVDPIRGRFRSFLLGAAKHFLADMRDHRRRLKRGGGQPLESIDPGTDTSPGLQLADPKAASPDREFDHKWALTLLERALDALAAEHRVAGKAVQFEALKPWLTGDTENISQAEAARQLGVNESAVKVAIHRLRRRFREVIKAEISQTLNEGVQVDEELHYLLEVLLG